MQILLLLFLALSAQAADQNISLTTARGAQIQLDIYNAGQPSVLVLAPGSGCGPRLDMYDRLGGAAAQNGFTLVRLYWAYCLTTPPGKASEQGDPEREDFATALNYVRSVLGYADGQISIGGKSLGTGYSYETFAKEIALHALVLLTPVCSEEGKSIWEENYPGLGAERRPVFMAKGVADPLCSNEHYEEFFSARGMNFQYTLLDGDHGFGVKNPDGTYDPVQGGIILDALSAWLFSHLK